MPCVYRIGCSPDDLGEDDPIGWFELEEEWDEAEIKLQQCRVARVSIIELWPSCIGPLPSFYSVSICRVVIVYQPCANTGTHEVNQT